MGCFCCFCGIADTAKTTKTPHLLLLFPYPKKGYNDLILLLLSRKLKVCMPDLPSPPDEIWVTPLTDTCLDDVTLPPGGVSMRAPRNPEAEHLRNVSRPDYLSHEGRDLRLDLMRGFFVFAMIIDHVRGESILYVLTGGNRFFTSAAEGFILISGLVTGLVYRRIIQREGMATGLVKVLSRALTLYLFTVGVTLAFTLFSEVTYMSWAQGIDFSDPVAFVISVFTLHQTYYLIDVMLLYTVLFLVTPLAFILLERGKLWVVLGGSWLLYLLYQFYPNLVTLPWPVEGNYLFNFSAWQVLFFSGLVLGYVQSRIPTLGCDETRIALIATGIGAALLVVLFFLIDPPTVLLPRGITLTSPISPDVREWIDEYIFSKADLRPGRLLASAVTFSFFFFGITHFWRQIRRFTAWLLLPMGQSALFAYATHIVVAGLVGLALKPFNLPPDPQILNAAIQITAIGLVWWVVRKQWGRPTPKNQRYWNTSPVAIGLLIVVVLWRFPLPQHPGLVQAVPVDPGASRVPRRYGTPVPKAVPTLPGQPTPTGPAVAQPTLQVTPTPEPAVTHPITVGGTDLLSSPYLQPTNGTTHERWFYSPELDRDMPYYIYLPPNYDTAGRRYPVLYLLHGLGGHREEWLAYGLVNVVDQEISNGNIPPMIVVLPQGDRDYWVNHAKDGLRWGEYIDRDLVRHIDATYRTLRSPASRAIGGLSMGGYGALSHAFTHPAIFGIVGAHSASLHLDDGKAPPFLGQSLEFQLKDPLYLARTAPNLDHLQIWIDIGQADDIWLPNNLALHQILLDRGIDHIWQSPPGGHDYDYWIARVIDYVHFYGHAFAGK
jgi:enterochelin esterase-like enzyme